jgi:tetratricopeptide (TPR) repeat protein
VVTASLDETARVWDARSGEPLTGPLKHEDSVTSASFSADGTRVVTASVDGTARVWDARSGEPLAGPLKHEGLVTSANFSADGTRVVTASWDETARIWDIAFDQSSTPAWASGLFDQIAGQHLDDKTGFPAMITRIDRKFNFQDPKETRAMFAKWLTADRSTRTISPLSSETIPQYIERRLEIDSEKAIKEAFIADPSQPLVLIAQAKFERDPERADFLRRYAIDRFGEQPATTWERAAEMLQKQKQLELALRCADQAIKLDPNLGAGHWRRSDLLWAQQKWDASFAASGEAIRLEPKKVDWLQERGYRYAQRGMADQAIVEFEKALGVAAEPKSRLNVVRGYGWALIDLEKPAEANEKFHSAATISPDPDKYSGLQAGLALSAWLMGNKDESIAAFVRLCALDQDYAKGPFIRQRDWSDKKISALQQIRAAAIAAHPELAPKPDSESPQAPSTQP